MQSDIKPKNIKKDIQWVYNVEMPYGCAQSWQPVGPADLPGPDPTGISCSQLVSVLASYKPTREPVGSVYLN
jgi:hypothetical protein